MDDEQRPTLDPGRVEEERSRARDYLDGNAATFEEIDRWIRAELARRYPRLSGEHEDLSQVVHENLIKSLRAGKYAGRSSLRGYITGIAHYVAIARLRELYRHRAITESLSHEPLRGAADNPYRTLEALDHRKLLHQLFLSLPSECRELWLLVFVEKLLYTDVAERLGIPPGTVKSRMWACRRKATAILRRIRARGHCPE